VPLDLPPRQPAPVALLLDDHMSRRRCCLTTVLLRRHSAVAAASAASPSATACATLVADASVTAVIDAGRRDACHAGPADGKGERLFSSEGAFCPTATLPEHCSPHPRVMLPRPANLLPAAASALLTAHAPCRTVMCRWIRGLSAKPSSLTLKCASMPWRACAPLASSSTPGATWGLVSGAPRQEASRIWLFAGSLHAAFTKGANPAPLSACLRILVHYRLSSDFLPCCMPAMRAAPAVQVSMSCMRTTWTGRGCRQSMTSCLRGRRRGAHAACQLHCCCRSMASCT
jgi:hypothetical protein